MSLVIRAVRFHNLLILAAIGLASLVAVPASAQQPAPSDPGVVTIAGGIEVLNQYMFRGIRQNSTEVAIWPSGDLGIRAYKGDGALTGIGVNIGFWNSLHTGDTGSQGPTGKVWYESDFSTTLRLSFGGGVSVGTTYVAYTSPNNMFTTVKEVAIKLAVDGGPALGRLAMKPYALAAFEVGEGQADGGLRAGKYLELGIAPGLRARRASIAVPVKLGLSIGDYYELAGKDNTFGFVSIAGVVTVPLRRTTSAGAWDIHGGVEYQGLVEATKVFNGGDPSVIIGTVGIGFSY